MKTIRVTLIDDSVLLRFLFANFMQIYPSCEIQTETFENGKDAWDHFNSIKHQPSLFPNLMFLDINMPLMNGWDLIENLAVNEFPFIHQIPIYIISSSSLALDKDKLNDYKFLDGYIIKPIVRQTIYKIIDDYLSCSNE